LKKAELEAKRNRRRKSSRGRRGTKKSAEAEEDEGIAGSNSLSTLALFQSKLYLFPLLFFFPFVFSTKENERKGKSARASEQVCAKDKLTGIKQIVPKKQKQTNKQSYSF